MNFLKIALPLLTLIIAILSTPASLNATPPVQLIADINTAGVPSDSDASQFTEMNGHVYFQGYTPDTGHELWRTDGTEAGTAMVSDILSGPDGSEPTQITAYGNYIYFLARGETNSTYFWKSDGTKAGTVQPLAGDDATRVTNFYVSENTGNVYLEISAAPEEHRVMRITPTGQKLVITTITRYGLNVRTKFFGDSGPYTYFSCENAGTGHELWRTNGTAAGTNLVSNNDSGPGATEFRGFSVLNESAYFLRPDGLWRTDGTLAGTSLVKSLVPATNGNSLVTINNTLIFAAGESFLSHRLWKSDGTAQGTQPIGPGTGTRPYGFVTAGDLAYYIAETEVPLASSGSPEIWRTDGTAAGTIQITNFNTPGDTVPTWLTPVGDKVYFRTYSTGDLYSTDGTIVGTQLIKEFEPTSDEGPDEWPIAPFGTSVIFTAEDTTGRHIWISDGTAEGTYRVYTTHMWPASADAWHLYE